jgi:uncharacterized protein
MFWNEIQQQQLLQVAWQSIQQGLAQGKPLPVDMSAYPPALTATRATFVTLQINHQLRGCIGTLQARRPLVEDVSANAFAAAFNDHRFTPLTAGEFENLSLYISILTPPEAMVITSEQDLLQQLQPCIDGLIIKEGNKRATFLPSVWESLPQPVDFLNRLKLKAGLPGNYWSDTMQAYRYQADKVG